MYKKTRIQRTTLEVKFKGYTYRMTQKKMVLPDTQKDMQKSQQKSERRDCWKKEERLATLNLTQIK
jgi:hypothetical protein